MKIIYATWGYQNICIDVTSFLQEKITNEELFIKMDHSFFPSNPCTFIKELKISYEYKGVIRNLIVQEQHGSNKRALIIKSGKHDTVNNIGTHGKGLLEISVL